MKNAIIVFFMMIILIFAGVSIQTAENRTTRKNELDNSLGTAMEQSMNVLTVNPVYHIKKEGGTDEFIADFIQGFLTKISSSSDFSIEILEVDVEKGLLDVRVVETYKQIIGNGKITSRKTVILEDLEETVDAFHLVSFLAGQESQEGEESHAYIWKQVRVHGGDNLSAAILPKANMNKEGYIFCGWRMTKPANGIGMLYGEENIGDICVKEELEFEAVYRQEEQL